MKASDPALHEPAGQGHEQAVEGPERVPHGYSSWSQVRYLDG